MESVEEEKLKAAIGSVDEIVGGRNCFKDALLAAMYSQVEFLRGELVEKNAIIQSLLERSKNDVLRGGGVIRAATDVEMEEEVKDLEHHYETIDDRSDLDTVSENLRRKLLRKVGFVSDQKSGTKSFTHASEEVNGVVIFFVRVPAWSRF